MSSWVPLLHSDPAQRVGWALMHSLWQLALIAAIFALLVRFLRVRSANARYLLGCTALLLMLLAPAATIVSMPTASLEVARMDSVHSDSAQKRQSGGDHESKAVDAPARAYISSHDSANREPFGASEAGPSALRRSQMHGTSGSAVPAPQTTIPTDSTSSSPAAGPIVTQLAQQVRPWLPWVTFLWLAGVILWSLRPLCGWCHIRRLQQQGVSPGGDSLQRAATDVLQQLKMTRAVQFVQSTLVEVPTVAGYLRPVVLLPATAITGLQQDELEMILAHELAHVRRHDSLVNLLQTWIEALLFFHPAMWWLSAQIRQERENCCDDVAVALSGQRTRYVQVLAHLEHQRIASTNAVLAVNGGSLVARARRLLGQDRSEFGYGSLSAWLGVLAVTTFIAGTFAWHQTSQASHGPAVVTAQESDDSADTARLSIDERVLKSFRVQETIDDNNLIRIDEPIETDPWSPQISGGSMRFSDDEYALHMPLWELKERLPVDLCFSVTFKVDADGAVFECEPVAVPRGETRGGYFQIRKAHDFWHRYNGFVPITITLKPFESKDPQHAHLTEVWQHTLESKSVRARAFRFKASEAPPAVKQVRTLAIKLAGIAPHEATSESVRKALQTQGIELQTAYKIGSMTSLNPYRRQSGVSVYGPSARPAIPFLIALLTDVDSLAQRPPAHVAAMTLARMGEAALPALLEQLDNHDNALRVQVVNVLNNMASNERRKAMTPTTLPKLLPLLTSSDAALRQATAHALHRFPHTTAVAPLITALKDESAEVRSSAALALGWNRDARAAEPLIAALQDPKDAVRQEAASALGRVPSNVCIEPLIHTLKNDTFSYARREAAWSLSYQKDRRAIPALVAALQDPEQSVIVAAAYGLGELPSQEAIEPLVIALDHGPNAMRAAARALKKITGQEIKEDAELWKAWHRQESAAGWGEPIDGVRCRLVVAEPKCAQEDVSLALTAQVRGEKDLLLSSELLFGCRLQIDDRWYDYAAVQEFVGPAYRSARDWEKQQETLTGTLRAQTWQTIDTKRALTLKPGKHVIRFAWAAYRPDYKTNPPAQRPPLRLVSNPVQIEIEPSPEPQPRLQLARPPRADARQRFLEIEEIARLKKPEQLKQLYRLYTDLAPPYMTPFIEGLLSSYRSHILDNSDFDGPGGDHTTRWAEQLSEAAADTSPAEVADKLEIGLWWNVAARARALQMFREHADATKSLIDADLKSGERASVARASATIRELDWRSFTEQLLTLLMNQDDASKDVFHALLFMRDPSIAGALLERVEQDPSFLGRCAGLFQGPLWRKPAEPLLLKLLDSPDRDLRHSAVQAVYECSDAKLARHAARFAADKEARFRIAAAQFASNLPHAAFVEVREALLPLLTDTDNGVSFHAIRCFAQQKDLAAGDTILKALRNSDLDEQYKITVIQSLQKLTDTRFDYDFHQWGTKTPKNRQAILDLSRWLDEKRQETADGTR